MVRHKKLRSRPRKCSNFSHLVTSYSVRTWTCVILFLSSLIPHSRKAWGQIIEIRSTAAAATNALVACLSKFQFKNTANPCSWKWSVYLESTNSTAIQDMPEGGEEGGNHIVHLHSGLVCKSCSIVSAELENNPFVRFVQQESIGYWMPHTQPTPISTVVLRYLNYQMIFQSATIICIETKRRLWYRQPT